MNTPDTNIPGLAEILAGPIPNPCLGPMVSKRPCGTVGISTFTDDEKKIFHYLTKSHYKTNLFFVSTETRRINLYEEQASKTFDLDLTEEEEEKAETEDYELLTLRRQEESLFEIFFNMLWFRLAGQIPPNAKLTVYEDYEIGYIVEERE